jgi:hypothetical protein
MKNINDNVEIDTLFNLIKSKVNEKDLRAYIYQKMYDPNNNTTCFQAVNELHFLTDKQMRQWRDGYDLRLLNFFQLQKLAEKLGILIPEHIYFFNPQFDFDGEDYRSYPQIFDFIENVSFDKAGLIALYSGINCSYHLFSSKLTEFMRSNSIIRIGMDGLVQVDDFSDDHIKTKFDMAVNWKYLNYSYKADLFGDDEQNFPDIKGRDILPIMKNWTRPLYSKDYLNQLDDESIAEKILQEDGCLIRHMPVSFKLNKDLCFTACLQNKLAYSLIPKKIQKNSDFIARLLDCKEIDPAIQNFIYFERKEAENELKGKDISNVNSNSVDKDLSIEKENCGDEVYKNEEESINNEALTPIWSPLIIDRFDSFTPNLTKKEPDYFELLAYLYQLILSDFVFAEPLIQKYSEILRTRPVEEILLDSELKKEIEDSLWQQGCYPQHIYIFNQRKPINKTDFKCFPTIFTEIVDITFDKGMLVLESFCQQINSLHDISGDAFLWECSDIIMGMDGLIAYRYCEDISGFWTFERFENGRLNTYGPSSDNYIAYDNNLTGFPFLFGLNRIKYQNKWVKPYCEPAMIAHITNKNVIESILQKDGCLIRYMKEWVKEDEELTMLACCQQEIAFTLISPKLQHDKEFVLKLYSKPDIDVNLFNFFNAELQKDKDIIYLKTEKIRVEKEMYDENQKKMISKYGEDELPF